MGQNGWQVTNQIAYVKLIEAGPNEEGPNETERNQEDHLPLIVRKVNIYIYRERERGIDFGG